MKDSHKAPSRRRRSGNLKYVLIFSGGLLLCILLLYFLVLRPKKPTDESTVPGGQTEKYLISVPPFPVTSPVIPDIDWTENPLPLTSRSQSKTYEDGGDVNMTLDAELPVSGIAEIDAYYANMMDDVLLTCSTLSENAAALKKAGGLSEPFSYTESYVAELNHAGLISICRRVERNVGMGNETAAFCDTFTVSGKPLFLDDFFAVPRQEYKERLMYSVIMYIIEHRDNTFDDADTAAAEAFPYDSFFITKNGISLFFPENTIAPQNTGLQRIDVPWEVFGDLWVMPES